MKSRRFYLCKCHPDFHIPADTEVGNGFDGEAYARRLARCGADAVVFFAKCHYGHSYYNTAVGYRHPGLRTDMLAEVVRGCRKHGVGIIAYLSVFLDTQAVLHHPEWGLRTSCSSTSNGIDGAHYLPVCVNSGYARQLFIPQAVEVATRYDIDELFFDTMTEFQPCFCDVCATAFGRPIPENDSDPAWLDYVKWYASCYDNFYAAVAEAVHDANPEIGITFNWEWGIRTPKRPPAHITRLAADLIPTGVVASEICHYFAGTGFPFDYMCGRFLAGLGDWTSNTRESLMYTAASTIANGGSFYIIDRQLPGGQLEERAYAMMQDVFSFIHKRRHVVEGTAHVPEIALLHSYDSLMGADLRFFPNARTRKERQEALDGASWMFMRHARHYTALSSDAFRERLNEYAVAILPEVEFLDSTTCEHVERYVRNGGNLLITQSASDNGLCPRLLELAGVVHEGFSELDYGYFGRERGEPIAVHGRFSKVRPTADAREIVPSISPMQVGGSGRRFGHGFAPPGVYEGYALATERTVGKGRVIYVAMPAFKYYYQYPNPFVAELLLSLIDRLLPRPLARVHIRAQVEMVAVRKGRDLIVHLVNHSGRERLGGYWYPVYEYMPELRGIDVEIRIDRRSPSITREPSGARVRYRRTGGYAQIRIPKLLFMESLRVRNYFAP